MSSLGQILFFAVGALLYLPPGANALQCRVCMAMGPGAFCLPNVACQAPPGMQACHALKTYLYGELQMKILDCKSKAMCGITESSPNLGTWTEHLCCNNGDFCNERL